LTGPLWEQVAGMAADVMGVDASTLDERSGPEQIQTWDSVQHLNLVLALEAQFSLQFEPEEIDQMTTLGRIAEIIKAHQGSTTTG